MTKIYWIKNVPEPVREWFARNFNNCSFNFYWYYKAGKDSEKIYGCEVFAKNGKFYHNATQAKLGWYITENIKDLARKYPDNYQVQQAR